MDPVMGERLNKQARRRCVFSHSSTDKNRRKTGDWK